MAEEGCTHQFTEKKYSETELRHAALEIALNKIPPMNMGLYNADHRGYKDVSELLADAKTIEAYLKGG